MRILVIISSHKMSIEYLQNIKILKEYLKEYNVSYCGISNTNDFYNYESIIKFKYKIINTAKQLNKICDFISYYKHKLIKKYVWYIKYRPDIKLLEPINFSILSTIAINARARVYNGQNNIKYGMSINGKGPWENIGCCHYNEIEKDIVLDDQFYIFHKNVINNGGFQKIDKPHINEWYTVDNKFMPWEHEWFHTNCWRSRNIKLNIIGIHLLFTKFNSYSGDINPIKLERNIYYSSNVFNIINYFISIKNRLKCTFLS
jgi:hypothetical protein